MLKNLLYQLSLAMSYKLHMDWLCGVSGGRRANLSRANLSRANLRWANLSRADLRWADLSGANLCNADLSGARYSLLQVLSASWGDVSDDLCVEMMRQDAAAHPDPGAFDKWADGGVCPLQSANIERLLSFNEKRNLYKPGKPEMTLWELWVALAEEKGIEI